MTTKTNNNKSKAGHGGGIRGSDVQDRSSQFEGRFGRMFRTLPPADFDIADLHMLAKAMIADPEIQMENGKPKRDPKTNFFIPVATKEDEVDDEENFGIPAGYTYLGQFIDHDLTFDPASSLQKQNDPDGLTDFRTPRFDLDCIYGRGPDDQPYMFDGNKFLFGRELTEGGVHKGGLDLLRIPANNRAVIGDKRNDENVIVSQLQGVFLRFHNAIADAKGKDASFAEVQQEVRWHYQWVVLHDFLSRIVGEHTYNELLPHIKSGKRIYDDPPRLQFYLPKYASFIPIEFSAAAYRFGHSMVRPIYRLNTELGKNASADEIERGVDGRQFIFAAVHTEGLNGFCAFPDIWSIDWNLFFEIDSKLSTHNLGKSRVQASYKIDTSLVNPLAFLPEFSKLNADDLERDSDGNPVPVDPVKSPSSLALRNLLRGLSMDLPSGQDVARCMGYTPLRDEDILIGKATFSNEFGAAAERNRSIVEYGKSFVGNAPLWTYILAEAQHDWRLRARGKTEQEANALPVHLGKVGGRIVAEVFIGLLLGDSHSFLSQNPNWKPSKVGLDGRFDISDLIRIALGAK
ncbi:MAG: peroxidase family protein [Methylobacter sp.]